MKRIHTWLAVILMAVGLGFLAPGPASATTSYCGLVWGSLAKASPDMSAASVTNVRTGQHYCFDRVVVDLNGPVHGYTARYVSGVSQDGSGKHIPVRGNAFLQLTVTRSGLQRVRSHVHPGKPAGVVQRLGIPDLPAVRIGRQL